MAKKIISILVSDEEYYDLSGLARENRMNLSQFCRSRLPLNNEFNEYYKKLLKKVEKLQNSKNLKFFIRDLWNVEEWNTVPKGIKLALGKQFYSDVVSRKIKNVDKDGFGSGRTMRYFIK